MPVKCEGSAGGHVVRGPFTPRAALGVPVTDQACRRLRRVMRELGWHGPRLMRWGRKTLKGYWRHPTVALPAIVQEEPVACKGGAGDTGA
jgi:hypothetical protein